MVFIHLVFGLLRLVFELTGQRGVLDHCELCGANELILVHVKHFDFNGSDLQEHFLA